MAHDGRIFEGDRAIFMLRAGFSNRVAPWHSPQPPSIRFGILRGAKLLPVDFYYETMEIEGDSHRVPR